jgi:hypothetical protein
MGVRYPALLLTLRFGVERGKGGTGMATLHGAMASLSISAPGAPSASSFWGNQLATVSAPLHGVCAASLFRSVQCFGE